MTCVPAHLPRSEPSCTRLRLIGGAEPLDGLEVELDGVSEGVLVILAVSNESGGVRVERHRYALGPTFAVCRHSG